MLLCSFGELCSHHQQVPVYTTTTANTNTNTAATATVAAGVFCVLM